MAKMTKAELNKRMAELQAEYEAEPEEEETLCVELPNGNKVYMKGDRLKAYLRKHGLEEDEVEIEEVEEEEIEKPVAAKKTAAKKTTVKKIAEEDPEEELEEDPKPGGNTGKGYWG